MKSGSSGIATRDGTSTDDDSPESVCRLEPEERGTPGPWDTPFHPRCRPEGSRDPVRSHIVHRRTGPVRMVRLSSWSG